jgi:hypothetical protein
LRFGALGVKFEFWKAYRGIFENIECLEGFGVKRYGPKCKN